MASCTERLRQKTKWKWNLYFSGYCVLLLALGPCRADEQQLLTLQGIDLAKTNFTEVLKSHRTDALVLSEFYASWCPACRHFKPEFEKIARYLIAKTPSGDKKVFVYRVDCATEQELCGKFEITGYPTLYFGKASIFADAKPKELNKYAGARTAADIVPWIGEKAGMDLKFEEVPEPASLTQESATGAAAASGSSDVKAGGGAVPTSTGGAASGQWEGQMKWTEVDVASATRQLFEGIAATPALTRTKEARSALQMLLQVLSVAHPVARCKQDAKAGADSLDQLWPAGNDAPTGDLKGLTVCSETDQQRPKAEVLPWIACRGSSSDSRGFTCGLWLLFHTASVRVPETDGGALLVSALRGWGHNFFQCEVCQKHFKKIVDDPAAKAVRSRQDVMLWLWRVHNEVNGRLAQVESKYGHSSSGDKLFPKQAWPPASICPLCQLPQLPGDQTSSSGSSSSSSDANSTSASGQPQWNEAEVVRFLQQWYSTAGSIKASAWSNIGAADGEKVPLLLGKNEAAAEEAFVIAEGTRGSNMKWWLLVMVGCLGGVLLIRARRSGTSRHYLPHHHRGYAVMGPGARLPAAINGKLAGTLGGSGRW